MSRLFLKTKALHAQGHAETDLNYALLPGGGYWETVLGGTCAERDVLAFGAAMAMLTQRIAASSKAACHLRPPIWAILLPLQEPRKYSVLRCCAILSGLLRHYFLMRTAIGPHYVHATHLSCEGFCRCSNEEIMYGTFS
jgi:hypothetical protein